MGCQKQVATTIDPRKLAKDVFRSYEVAKFTKSGHTGVWN